MDTQIRKMMDYIKKLSEGRGSGIATVSFGRLFTASSDDMPALAATLAVAKKRKVVHYVVVNRPFYCRLTTKESC